MRQGAQRRAGASSDALDNNISNTEKICMQLFLDIQVFIVFVDFGLYSGIRMGASGLFEITFYLFYFIFSVFCFSIKQKYVWYSYNFFSKKINKKYIHFLFWTIWLFGWLKKEFNVKYNLQWRSVVATMVVGGWRRWPATTTGGGG